MCNFHKVCCFNWSIDCLSGQCSYVVHNTTLEQTRKMHPWEGLSIQTPQLQHHLWTVSLLMQSCLGWQHQTQQATCLRVGWINLLHSDAAHIQPGTNSMEVQELCITARYKPAWHLGYMGWSVYLSTCYIMSVHCFCGKYSVSTLLVPSYIC